MTGSAPNDLKRKEMTVPQFLKQHGLGNSTENRKFAELYINGVSATIVRIVNEFVENGLRIRPGDVTSIMNEAGFEIKAAEKRTESFEKRENRMRGQILKTSEIARSGASKAASFSDVLTKGANDLARNAPQGDEGATIRALVKIIRKLQDEAEEFRDAMNTMSEEADAIRIALENSKAEANKDYLTGLPNRQAAEKLFAEIRQTGEKFAVAFCDIDNFKRINDTYSHHVGDRVLKAIAEELQKEADKHTVCRWGGEEFIIIFRDVSISTAAAVTNRAREAFLEREFNVRKTDKPLNQVSFSAGVAGGHGPHASIIDKADKLMYQAKEAGKNRVVSDANIIERVIEVVISA